LKNYKVAYTVTCDSCNSTFTTTEWYYPYYITHNGRLVKDDKGYVPNTRIIGAICPYCGSTIVKRKRFWKTDEDTFIARCTKCNHILDIKEFIEGAHIEKLKDGIHSKWIVNIECPKCGNNKTVTGVMGV